MPNSADALRRWLGVFCLAVAAGMLIWGQTVLEGHLRGRTFLIYWLVCFGFTIAAIVIALRDIRVLRRRTRQEQRKLVEATLEEVDHERKDRQIDR